MPGVVSFYPTRALLKVCNDLHSSVFLRILMFRSRPITAVRRVDLPASSHYLARSWQPE